MVGLLALINFPIPVLNVRLLSQGFEFDYHSYLFEPENVKGVLLDTDRKYKDTSGMQRHILQQVTTLIKL